MYTFVVNVCSFYVLVEGLMEDSIVLMSSLVNKRHYYYYNNTYY